MRIDSVKLSTVVMQRQRRKCKIILVSTYSNFIEKRKLEEKYRRLIFDLYLWKRLEKKSVWGNSGLRLFVSDRNTMPTSFRLNIQFRNVMIGFDLFFKSNSRQQGIVWSPWVCDLSNSLTCLATHLLTVSFFSPLTFCQLARGNEYVNRFSAYTNIS